MADTTAPILTGLVLPSSFDVSSTQLKVAATAEDNVGGTGVDRVVIYLDRDIEYSYGAYSNFSIGRSSGLVSSSGGLYGATDLFRDSTPTTGNANVALTSATSNGIYNVRQAWVYDVAGNVKRYSTVELNALGFKTSFSVTGGTNTVPVNTPAVSFTQTTNTSDQIVLSMNGTSLPTGTVNFSISFTYLGSNVSFNSIKLTGSSSTTVSANSTGSSGTVTISGNYTPSGNSNFGELIFDAAGTGSFDATITNFRLGTTAVTFSDPPPFTYNIVSVPLKETMSTYSGKSISGVFNPFDSYFASGEVALAPSHGTVTFDPFQKQYWTYTPSREYSGTDQFTISVTEGGKLKEKIISVNIASAPTTFDSSVLGSGKNDLFSSGVGNQLINGGDGIDVVSYVGERKNFVVSKTDSSFIVNDVVGNQGIDKLLNVEKIVFSDVTVSFETAGNAGKAYRLYQAAFDRTPDQGGLGTWIGLMDKGMSLEEVSSYFQRSDEFKSLYGTNVSIQQFVDLLYKNVLGRSADANGYATWQGVLNAGTWTREQVLIGFSESMENQVKVIGSIQNGIEYLPAV